MSLKHGLSKEFDQNSLQSMTDHLVKVSGGQVRKVETREDVLFESLGEAFKALQGPDEYD
jgi:hypothetical protein